MEKALLLTPPVHVVGLPDGNDHPVIDMPFTAVIDGRQFRGRGLSLVAAYVSGLIDPALLKATRIVRLDFDFNGFSIGLVVEAEVRQSQNGSGEVQLSFVRPTGSHLPQLRHLINAFIAGDLVGMGNTIAVAGASAPKGHRAAIKAESRLSLRGVVGGFAIGALSVALFAAAGTLIWQRAFVTPFPTPGIVVTSGETLRATSTGQIMFLNTEAPEGEVVVAIQTATGAVQSIMMPCTCMVRSLGLSEGSTILVGEPMLQIVSDTDETLVAANVPDALLFDLTQADRVELHLADGSTVLAAAQMPIASRASDTAAADSEPVLLVPQTPLPAAMLGQPVEVRMVRDPALPAIVANAWAKVPFAFEQLSSLYEGI